VDARGIITTVAGGGTERGGAPTLEAKLFSPVGVAVDAAGNLYIAEIWGGTIQKVALLSNFADTLTGGDISFSEANGIGYILSSAGRHKRTIDQDTGAILREFGYDEDNNLLSISDRFGNQSEIQRDESGVPTSIISPDGITTTLTIDENNHLSAIIYPDGSSYSFEYTPDGLMSAKIEPKGNRFEHSFDDSGHMTVATDEEGGHWQYSKTGLASGYILTRVQTAEGNLTSYLDYTDSLGAYSSTITDPTGADTFYSSSADGYSVNKSLP